MFRLTKSFKFYTDDFFTARNLLESTVNINSGILFEETRSD